MNSIENIIGTSNDGSYTGNSVANMIDGGAGKDLIHGLEGDDIFIDTDMERDLYWGGDGSDTISWIRYGCYCLTQGWNIKF